MIDDLDKQWADDRIRIKLIEALINALPKFRKVHNVKIVVAMRDDLLDTVLDQASTSGFQREKFKDYHQRLTWKSNELKNLINYRVTKLFKKQYTSESVYLDDVIEKSKTNIDHFEYILQRTLMRPRDILSYFNMIFERCGGHSKITLKDIRSVEFEYSKLRRQALIDEWRDHVPCVETIISVLANRKLSSTFRLGTVSDDIIDQAATQLYADNQDSTTSLILLAKTHFEENNEHSRQAFCFKLFATLYRIGAVGLRTQENSAVQFSYMSKPSISEQELGQNTWCLVHPMLWQSLGRRGDTGKLAATGIAT